MPYDTNGNYTLPSIYFAVTGTVINPSQHNNPFQDVQAALNRVFLRDGTAPLTGPLQANGNKITGLAKGAAAGEAATFDQISGFISASDADKKYVLNNGGTNGGITRATIDEPTGQPAFADGEGNWHVVQYYGDYATTAQLNTEIQRATTIESNLQSSKVSKSGDTMNGGLTVESYSGFTASISPNSANTGDFINYPAFYSVASGRGGQAVFGLQEHVGTTFTLLLSLQFNDGTWRYVGWGQNQRINDSQYGDVAYTSDLANYQPKGDYALTSQLPTSGTITGGTYTKIPMNDGTGRSVLTQCFSVSVTTNSVITFPIALSAAPSHVNFEVNQNIDCDHSYTDETESSLIIHLWQSGTIQIDVMVIGVVS